MDVFVVEPVGTGLKKDAGFVDADEACGGGIDHPDGAVGERDQVDGGEDDEVGHRGGEGFKERESEMAEIVWDEQERCVCSFGDCAHAKDEHAKHCGCDFQEAARVFNGVEGHHGGEWEKRVTGPDSGGEGEDEMAPRRASVARDSGDDDEQGNEVEQQAGGRDEHDAECVAERRVENGGGAGEEVENEKEV